jgi:hypothetical protein
LPIEPILKYDTRKMVLYDRLIPEPETLIRLGLEKDLKIEGVRLLTPNHITNYRLLLHMGATVIYVVWLLTLWLPADVALQDGRMAFTLIILFHCLKVAQIH